MTWVAWRQQRYVFWAFTVASVALMVWAILSGTHVESLSHLYQSAPCHAGNGIPRRFISSCMATATDLNVAKQANYWIAAFAYILPVALGIIVGTGVMASELDRKTARLAWTQSVTRTRWVAVKVAVAVASMSLILVPLGVTFTWWIGASQYATRMSSNGFSESGWMLGVTAVFALALAILVGVLVRQPGSTIAATAVLFLAAQMVVAGDVRPHLVPLSRASITATTVTKGTTTVSITYGGASADSIVVFSGLVPLDWGTARPPSSVVRRSLAALNACERSSSAVGGDLGAYCMHELGLRDEQLYISEREFWTLQMREGSLYLGAAALLFGVSVVVLRRIRV